MPPKTRPQPPQRYVYVIGPTKGLQKIGLAIDPQSRLAALKTASAIPLILHVAVPVAFARAHAVEARAHLALAIHRGSGEWFDVLPKEAIATVQLAARAEEPFVMEAMPLPLFAYSHLPHPDRAIVSNKPDTWRALRQAYQRVVGRL